MRSTPAPNDNHEASRGETAASATDNTTSDANSVACASETDPPIDRVLLIPGLLEPRTALLPMRQHLRRHAKEVTIWRDRYAFRNTEASVQRLSEFITDASREERIGIVTHSFGDWVARQAIARSPNHRVDALASIAPVIRSGFVPKVMHYLGGDLMPEIAVIANAEKARESLDCDRSLRRMVIWALIDLGVGRADLTHLPNVKVHRVAATHLSVVLQPNVFRLVERFLFDDQNGSEPGGSSPSSKSSS
ncbi:esterase/lipase family protein [Rhodopirellula sallentina]|uniref:esterase/lipase family protein n=1 Tax=Rhodopirellula sallentina TaxID=1263869 RepID=UPI0005C7C6F2|nr:alpha/beta hydrolase [Rhodopirellula sallentina]